MTIKKVAYIFLSLLIVSIIYFFFACDNEKDVDIEPPTVSITSPIDSQIVYDEFSIEASAVDDEGVNMVEFFIDGMIRPGGVDISSPYQYIWNTTDEQDSSFHSIYAIAYDRSNNFGISDTVTCIVDNTGRLPLAVDIYEPSDIKKHSMMLKWEQSIDKDFKEYRLFRNTSDEWDSTATLIVAIHDIETTFFDDTGLNADSSMVTPWGLEENRAYYYRVVVRDTLGLDGVSNVVSATTKLPEPVILKESYQSTKYSVKISWYSTTEDVRYFRVHRSKIENMESSLSDSVGIASPYETTFIDTGLTALSVYYYRVFLIDSAGYSVGSNIIRVQTIGVQTIELETPTEKDIAKCSITLRWTRSIEEDDTDYILYRAKHSGVTVQDSLVIVIGDKDVTIYSDIQLEQGETYYYIIYLKDSRGNLSASNEVSATTLKIQPLPISSIGIEKYEATLQWEKYPDTDFDRFILYRGLNAGFDTSYANKKYYFYDVNLTQFTDTELDLNTGYYYKFFVFDTFGYGAFSEVSFQTKCVQAVEIKDVEPFNDQFFRLTYTMNRADKDFDHYSIFRSDSTPDVDQNSLLVSTVPSRSDTVFDDYVHMEQLKQYFYRVYVFDERGNSCSGSNVKGDTLNSPPDSVTLYFQSSTNTTIELRWSKNQNIDFLRYDLYRCPHDDFTKNSTDAIKIASLYDKDLTSYIDQNLPSGVVCYYRIYVFDIGGLYAASNIVCGYTMP